MSLQTSLESLGLSKTEIAAYTALLQIGSSTVQELVRKSGLKRTTAYGALNKLIKKQLVAQTKTKYKQVYAAKNPNDLANLIDLEEQSFQDDRQEILKIIPQLSAIYSNNLTKPVARFYEGRENMKQVFRELLLFAKGYELLGYSSAEELAEGWWSDFAKYFIEQRVASKITDRSICEDAPFMQNVQKNDKNRLSNTILIDQKKYPLHGHTFIYGNNVLVASFKDQLSLVLENKHFAETEKSLFELARIGAQEVGKVSPDPYIKSKQKDGH